MLAKIKTSLRISSTAFDAEIQDLINAEIQDLINAALLDLALAGVLNLDQTDALIIRAVTTYVKAHFGWDNPDSARLHMSYEMLRNHLTQSIDYTVVEE